MRALPPTQSPSPPGCAVLVYDGGCEFCRWAARWVEARAREPLAVVPFDEVPRDRWLSALDEEQFRASAHYITPEGVERHGGSAMTSALLLTSWARVARLLDRWPWARDVGYAGIARTRGLWSRVVPG
jgi:predicted DCC family thiol-disulfide oxidoreductase YuxK